MFPGYWRHRQCTGLVLFNLSVIVQQSALANTRKILAENPGAIDSRVFTLKNRGLLKEIYLHKIDVMGSANKA